MKGIFIVSGFIVLFAIGGVIILSGKNNEISHKVILYSSDGKEIKRWISKGPVNSSQGTWYFYDKYSESNKEIKISGTVIVE